MPRLSIFCIRTSLLYLVLAFTFGGLLLANKGIPISPLIWRFLPLHVETVFLGWIVQLAMGVAYWILPRFVNGPARGAPAWGWAAFGLLNTGILLVILAALLNQPAAWTAGRVLELLGVAAFVLGSWRRVRPTYPPSV